MKECIGERKHWALNLSPKLKHPKALNHHWEAHNYTQESRVDEFELQNLIDTQPH